MKINKRIILTIIMCILMVVGGGIMKVSAKSEQILIQASIGGSVAPSGTYYDQAAGYFEVNAHPSTGYKFAYWYTDPNWLGITVEDVEDSSTTAYIDGINSGALYAQFIPIEEDIVIPEWVYQYETGNLHSTVTTEITTTTLPTTTTTTTTETVIPENGYEVIFAVNMYNANGSIANFPPYGSVLEYIDSKVKAEVIGDDGIVKETKYAYWVEDNGVNGYFSGSNHLYCNEGDVIRFTALPTGLYDFTRWELDDGIEYVGGLPAVPVGGAPSTITVKPTKDGEWVIAKMKVSSTPSIYKVDIDWQALSYNSGIVLGVPEITGGTLSQTGAWWSEYLVEADGILTLYAPNNGDGYFQRWVLEGSYEIITGEQAYIMENNVKYYFPDEYISPEITIKVKGDLQIWCDYSYKNYNQDTYSWTIDIRGGQGSIDVMLGNGTIKNYTKKTILVTNKNESIILTAKPGKGSVFSKWKVNTADGREWQYADLKNNIPVKSDVNVVGKTFIAVFSETSITTTPGPGPENEYRYLKVYLPKYNDEIIPCEVHMGYDDNPVNNFNWVALPKLNEVVTYYDYYGEDIEQIEPCYVAKVGKGTTVTVKYISNEYLDQGEDWSSPEDDITMEFASWQGDIQDYTLAKYETINLAMDKDRKIYINLSKPESGDIVDNITESIEALGMNNTTGHWIITIVLMGLAFIVFRNDEKLRVLMPVLVLGGSIIIGWLSGIFVILLVIVAGVASAWFIKNKVIGGA